jgi:predicted CoA-substrate-specific enzyme activase
MEIYLGIDCGSITTKLAALDADRNLLHALYLRTQGKPIPTLQEGLEKMRDALPKGAEVAGVATTGSARYLAGVVVGADLVKNEITAHAVGALQCDPQVQTVIEIGGQDSKIIILRDGVVTDFAMNTVCAAGTGSFLDHQADRLGIKIEDFGSRALLSKTPVRVAGRCTVFAESDMIHKQQMGHPIEDVLYGLCQALARNYLNNVALGKDIRPPVVFQGGVAFNAGIIKAFREALKLEITVPPNHESTGAIGAAVLAMEEVKAERARTRFKGFGVMDAAYQTTSFECKHCANQCEITQLGLEKKVLARWGGRCDRWERVEAGAGTEAGAAG